MNWLRKGTIWIHRYLGIALSILFVVWFISGIGMMFAGGMPLLSLQERLQREPAIDLSQVRLSPAEAFARAFGSEGSAGADAGSVAVRTILDRPVYRIAGSLIYADDGTAIERVDPVMAKQIAGRFTGADPDRMTYEFLEESDQWTLTVSGFPLHKLTVDDDRGTQLYVSPETGQVVQMTTRGSRALAWVAAIPHWFYFKSLRNNQSLWFQVVCWTAALGCVLALAGVVLSFTQLRIRGPFRLSKLASYIPYSGWMRWHYVTGAVFGILTFTWVFSGLLSMEPFGWAAGETLQGNLRSALRGGSLNPGDFPAIDAAAWKQLIPGTPIKEIDYARIQGDPYFVVRVEPEVDAPGRDRPHQPYFSRTGVDPTRVLINAKTMAIRGDSFSAESLMAKVRETWPDVPVVESTMLSDYDSYYYSRDRQRPLPVLRVKFDDPVKTWIYIDATMSQQVAAVHRLDRFERWIYNGFHSLDFSFWYYNKPVWYTAVIVLSLGGAAVSIIGMYLGFKRLGRGTGRLVKPA